MDCEALAASGGGIIEDDAWASWDDAWDSMFGDDDFRRGSEGVDVDAEDPCQGESSADMFDGWFDWF